MESVKKIDAETLESIVDFAFTIAYPFALRAVAVLNVPKIIQSAGPGATLSAQEICSHFPNPEKASSVNLEKILEVLSCHGVFSVERTESTKMRKYGLTELSQELARDEAADCLTFFTAPEVGQIWPHLHLIVSSPQEVVFEKVYGKGIYQYLKEDVPELGQFHVKTMERISALQLTYLLEYYDEELRSLTGTLVDVGGSQGGVAAVIASKYPNVHSVVNFDLPDVVAKAPALRGVEHVGGSFLDFVPRGDLLFMKFVLLNWSDEETTKILRNCYNALPAKGKVIIVDRVKPESVPEAKKARLRIAVQDMISTMAFKGAKSRTLQQLRSAAEAAGFARLQIVQSLDTLSFIEAEKE